MQEEVENRTVNMAVSTTKLTARTVVSAIRWWAMNHNNKRLRKAMEGRNGIAGEQTVKELLKTGEGIETIELPDGRLKDFCKIAKDYGIDYAIRKDITVEPPRYTVFFKAKNQDVMQEALREFSARYEKKEKGEPGREPKEKKPSVLAQLRKYKEECAKRPKKERHKQREKAR